MPVSCQTLFDTFQDRLGLQWLAGQRGDSLTLPEERPRINKNLVGFLSMIRPNCIQVMGHSEIDYLQALDNESLHEMLDTLFDQAPRLFIIADNLGVSQALIQQANQYDVPLWQSTRPAADIIAQLRHYLEATLHPATILHGVFMEVLGIGVLLTGCSGIGKSELALELLTRGHRLIADDAPEFSVTHNGVILGKSPTLLKDFLEVRGLGILNVRAMYGDNAVLEEKPLQLILNLVLDAEENGEMDMRLGQAQHSYRLFEQDIPDLPLLVAAGRNLAVIVEAAVRNYVLNKSGYSSSNDFMQRQKQQMEKNAP